MRACLICLAVWVMLTVPVPHATAETARWVTLGAAVTETVFALGAGEQVVATDTTSHYPEAARGRPKVGYLRALNPEGLLALQPTGILADDQAGPAHTREIIERAGLPWHPFRAPISANDTLALIRGLGERLNRQDTAAKLAEDVARRLEKVSRAPSGQRAVLLLHVHGRQLLAGGADTQAAALLALAGLENAWTFQGYKPVSTDALLASQPDWLVVAWARSPLELGSRSELKGLAAVRQGRVIQAPASLLLSFGPRLPEAVAQLTRMMDSYVADAH